MRGEREMDFGVTGKLGGCYLAEQYRKNAAESIAGFAPFGFQFTVDSSKSLQKNFSNGKSFLSHTPCGILDPHQFIPKEGIVFPEGGEQL